MIVAQATTRPAVGTWQPHYGAQIEPDDLERIGIYDPRAADAEDRLRLLRFLLDRGAGEEELVRAVRAQNLGALAVDLALRGPGPALRFEEAAARAGIALDDARRLWRALGFPDPAAGDIRLTEAETLALDGLARVSTELLVEQWEGLARVLGSSSARLADALVNSVRVGFEAPRRTAGVAYSVVVEGFVELAERQLDGLLALFGVLLRRHLVAAAATTWSFDENAAAARRELAVGFVDVVGYTALSRTLDPRALSQLLERLERAVLDAAGRHGGRLVKLIGDGAMVTVDSPAGACRLGLDLLEGFARDPTAPAIRVGLAHGSVIALNGDYYGEVVNLAARLVTVAAPATVVASEELARLAGEDFTFAALPPSELKGLPPTPRAQLLARR